jgi:hypothetical protein
MVPQVFVFLDALPRTGSGKVDRGELLPPDRARPELATPFAPPRDEIESLLVVVWATVLDLGGHSLAAMRVATRVTQAVQVEVPMGALLAAGTVAEMAAVVREHVAGTRASN